jgi:hypothetical protein
MKENLASLPTREIDALVAVHIFMLTIKRDVWDTRSCNELTPKYDIGVVNQDGSITREVDYSSTSITQAMEVLEKMKEEGFSAYMDNYPLNTSNRWCVDMLHDEALGRRAYVEAETLPMAICLAALECKGKTTL